MLRLAMTDGPFEVVAPVVFAKPCYARPCQVLARWRIVDTSDRGEIFACDRHAANGVHRRMRQIGRGAQVVVQPTGGILHVADLGVLLALGADIGGVVGMRGVPKAVSELSTDAFADLVRSFGGRVNDE